MASSPAATQPIHSVSNTWRVAAGGACKGRLNSKVAIAIISITSAVEINSFNTADGPLFGEITDQSWSWIG